MRTTILAMALLACVSTANGADSRPNIILFLADDMGQGDTSAYQDFTQNSNASQVHTPTMERLAASGLRFTDGHSPAAFCNPTRISLLRGGRTVRTAEQFGTALPAMLKRSGYRTYGVGKWHVFFEKGQDFHASSPIKLCALDFGFDHYTGTQHNITKSPAYHIDRVYQKYDANTKSLVPNDSKNAPGYGNPGGPIEFISQQLWLNAARGYMNEHAAGADHADQPFFLYYPSHANHNKLLPAADLDGVTVKGACKTADGRALLSNRDSLRLDRSEMIYENDVAVRLLLKWLGETDDPRNPSEKMLANTMFIFSSDNGANEKANLPANGRLSGSKGKIEEGGHREPFIVSWSGRIPAGVTSSAQISLLDMFATLAAVAGEELADDEAVDSFNMLDTFLHPDTAKPRPKGIYAAQALRPTHLMIRDGDFKIVWETTKPLKFTGLYNLRKDLGESRNLLGSPEFAQIEKKLKRQARAFLKDGRSRPRAGAASEHSEESGV
ncbi:Arylsulfatase [Planctomycetes bacterium CA13]|uniref:Arylsulfatase n=1 Tax=Novipirellula herctigrandis TaxID=2527986 RepID=A0A5C5ZBU6_9BACT|nr:Arylsulfatase [Planctomycetes bacterium CA13]